MKNILIDFQWVTSMLLKNDEVRKREKKENIPLKSKAMVKREKHTFRYAQKGRKK